MSTPEASPAIGQQRHCLQLQQAKLQLQPKVCCISVPASGRATNATAIACLNIAGLAYRKADHLLCIARNFAVHMVINQQEAWVQEGDMHCLLQC